MACHTPQRKSIFFPALILWALRRGSHLESVGSSHPPPKKESAVGKAVGVNVNQCGEETKSLTRTNCVGTGAQCGQPQRLHAFPCLLFRGESRFFVCLKESGLAIVKCIECFLKIVAEVLCWPGTRFTAPLPCICFTNVRLASWITFTFRENIHVRLEIYDFVIGLFQSNILYIL